MRLSVAPTFPLSHSFEATFRNRSHGGRLTFGVLLLALCILCFIFTTFEIPGLAAIMNYVRWGALFFTTGLFFLIRRRQFSRFRFPVLLFLFSGFVSSMNSEVQAFSLAKLAPLACTVVLMFYLLPVTFSADQYRKAMELIAWILVLLTFISGCKGVVTGRILTLSRYGGLFGGPNSEGTYAGFGVLSALWLYSAYPRAFYRHFLVGCIVLNTVAVYATGSRGAFFAALGGGMVWGATQLIHSPSQRKRQVMKAVVVFAVLLIGGREFFFSVRLRSMMRTNTSDSFLASRIEKWRASYDAFQKKPWFGYGYGASEQTDDKMEIAASGERAVRDGTGYFAVLESIGAIGGSAFVLLMIAVCRLEWRVVRLKVVNDFAFAAHGAFAYSVFLLLNLGSEPWILGPGNPTFQLFWFFIASVAFFAELALAEHRRSIPRSSRLSAGRLSPRDAWHHAKLGA